MTPTLLAARPLVILSLRVPDRKLLLGVSVLAPCIVVLNVGVHADRATATVRSSIRGSILAIWMPRLFSSASLTASSTVRRRTCSPGAAATGTPICADAGRGLQLARITIKRPFRIVVIRIGFNSALTSCVDVRISRVADG